MKNLKPSAARRGRTQPTPAVQGEPVGWESIDGLTHDPDEDGLFWFARSDGYVEGPRRIQSFGYDYDEFEFFRPVEPPALYTAPQPAPDVAGLMEALESLIKGYVGLLEAGVDRITSLGGDCDPVPVMEQNDPWLRDARKALAAYRKGDTP